MLRSFVTDGINPMNSFHLRHAKLMAFVAMESTHNTIFHFIETMKVRSQARNLKSGDTSHYFKNQVEKKPLISGVVSGFLGAATGAFTFMYMHDLLTMQLYSNVSLRRTLEEEEDKSYLGRMQKWDFRVKNLLIYVASDICASCMKVTFEVRKQLIQMYVKDTPLGMMMHASRLSLMPLMLRDTLFRTIHIGFFYASTDIEHKPMLMYSVPQITDFMR
jgi:hypothetical protein